MTAVPEPVRIARIQELSNFRIFRSFRWPDALSDFARFNVIYGWNGTGKSTLSNFFWRLESGESLEGGSGVLKLSDGRTVSACDWKSDDAVPIRVFNADVIRKSIYETDAFEPIVIVGAENKDKQQRIETLAYERKNLGGTLEEAEAAAKKATKSLEDALPKWAKEVKDFVSVEGVSLIPNYNRAHLETALKALASSTEPAVPVDADRIAQLFQQIKATHEPEIDERSLPKLELQSVVERIAVALRESVVSQTIETFTTNPRLGRWAKEGVDLHGEGADTCLFCGNRLSQERRDALTGHFSDSFEKYSQKLRGLESELKGLRTALEPFTRQVGVHVYRDLETELNDCWQLVAAASDSMLNLIGLLEGYVGERRSAPFACAPEMVVSAEDAKRAEEQLIESVKAANAVIAKHNERSRDFSKNRQKAVDALRDAKAAEYLERYRDLTREKTEADAAVGPLKDKIVALDQEIERLRQEIMNHRGEADGLTADLQAYLDRDDLEFVAKETGYAVRRKGDARDAHHLSEGEKTAVAFIHFLRALSGEGFDKKRGVVVIDDPISSLDTNSLFSAFAFMKVCTEDCAQLFVLTHSFSFFRQVKSWFGKKNENYFRGGKNHGKPAPAGFYQLRTCGAAQVRCSTLGPLDPLLNKFESEYQYLFCLVSRFACGTVNGLEAGFHVPNSCRRMLEAFLAFKYPDCPSLHDGLKKTGRPESEWNRFLRPAHVFSHADRVNDGEEEPLSEDLARKLANDALRIIKHVDENHFDGLTELAKRYPS